MIAYPPGISGVGLIRSPSGSNLLRERSAQSCALLLLPCLAYFIYPRKTTIFPGIMRVSLGVIAISPGVIRISSGEIAIHFQLISSCINGISADIISISAYRKAIYDYRKAVPVLFYVAFFCILCTLRAAGLHKKCKKHISPIKKRAIKRTLPRSWVRPLISCPLIK